MGSYRVFDLDAAFAKVYAASLETLIERASNYAGHEEDVELRLLQRNDSAAVVCCFDPQRSPHLFCKESLLTI